MKMTAMPQMVALFNGAGGGAAALVATADFIGQMAIAHPKLLSVGAIEPLGTVLRSGFEIGTGIQRNTSSDPNN